MISPDPMSSSPLAESLVRIGRTAIAKQDDAALAAYFAPGYRLHRGDDTLVFDQLAAYFASLRAAFRDLEVERAAIVGEGLYLASRTVFSGLFADVFTLSPVGELQPNGRLIRWEAINLFRFDEDGRLAEEWIQYDVKSLLEKLQG